MFYGCVLIQCKANHNAPIIPGICSVKLKISMTKNIDEKGTEKLQLPPSLTAKDQYSEGCL